MSYIMKLALCQLNTVQEKASNLRRAREMLFRAADQGAQMAVLPEMFSIAYVASLFAGAAEPCPGGDAYEMLSEAARQTGMFIVGGSVPELDDGRIYNTSMAFNDKGAYLGKYRKAHLFDVDVPGKFSFKESAVLTPGEEHPMMVDGPMRCGVMICFDIRFPEWSRLAMDAGADLLILPAAFALNTGIRHWELLLRTRALDNQFFVAAVAPAQSPHSYGHSLIVSPDGQVLHDCMEEETLAVVDIDTSILQEMRTSIPVRDRRRKDLYGK